jgi:hypothetical protein
MAAIAVSAGLVMLMLALHASRRRRRLARRPAGPVSVRISGTHLVGGPSKQCRQCKTWNGYTARACRDCGTQGRWQAPWIRK